MVRRICGLSSAVRGQWSAVGGDEAAVVELEHPVGAGGDVGVVGGHEQGAAGVARQFQQQGQDALAGGVVAVGEGDAIGRQGRRQDANADAAQRAGVIFSPWIRAATGMAAWMPRQATATAR